MTKKQRKKVETEEAAHCRQAQTAFNRSKRNRQVQFAGTNPWILPKKELTEGQSSRKEKAE